MTKFLVPFVIILGVILALRLTGVFEQHVTAPPPATIPYPPSSAPASEPMPTPSLPEIQILWDIPVKTHIRDIATGDLDGDGISDVVASVADGGSIGWSVVAATGPEGAILWKFGEGLLVADVEIDDVNADGANEVVVADWRGNLFLLDRRGNILWEKTVAEISSLVLSDIDRDGDADIVVGIEDRIVTLDEAGKTLWEFKGDLSMPTLVVGDINGDKINDIAAVKSNRAPGESAVVYAISGQNGSELWQYAIPAFSSQTTTINTGTNSVALAHLAHRPGLDVVAAFCLSSDESGTLHNVVAIEGQSGKEMWKYRDTTESNVVALVTGDLDGDSFDEVVRFGGQTVALNSKGTELWKDPQPIQGAAVYDFDNDGSCEVVAESRLLSGVNGDVIGRLPRKENGQVGAVMVIVLDDVTGDRKPELITGHHPSAGVCVFQVQ